jgi:uncharacterized membrane protein required for colicin V production
MNLFDIIIFAISGLSILMGLYKGFIGLSIGLIAFICSITATYFLEPIVKVVILEHVQNDLAAGLIAGIASFLLCTIFFSVLSGQVRGVLKEISGGMIDRLCGLVAGALRALLISLAILSLIVIFVNDAYINVANLKEMSEKIDQAKFPKWVTGSKSYPILTAAAEFIGKHISKEQLEQIKLPTRSKPSIPSELQPTVNITIDKEQSIKMSVEMPKDEQKEKTLAEELKDLDK